MTTVLQLVEDAAARLDAAGVAFGHGTTNAWDEAAWLVLWRLDLPLDDLDAVAARVVDTAGQAAVRALVDARIASRKPAAYLTGEAWFAGMAFKSDSRALVPRSPIAEIIEAGFEPWLHGRSVHRAMDLCTGSGCIGIAMAAYNPDWHVDCVDLSDDALSLARENLDLHRLGERVRLLKSDLFSGLEGERYELIVSNPPYVTNDEVDALPGEYDHEPELGLRAGDDGLDLVLRILRDAPDHLDADGLLICEVGESERALVDLLPELPLSWVEFKVGAMGVFVAERADLIGHHSAIVELIGQRGQG